MFRKGKESIMAGNGKKHGFTHTLTFKVLCSFVVLFVLGLIYNFIVAENSDISEEEKEVEEQRKAAQDTLDIVGNYLWPDMKPRTEDLLSDEEKAKTEADKKANEAVQKKAAPGGTRLTRHQYAKGESTTRSYPRCRSCPRSCTSSYTQSHEARCLNPKWSYH